MPFRIGKLLLLCASYVFYMWWDPRFIVLILTSTVVDYFLGIWLEVTSGRRKKLLLAVSLVVNLGFLGFFKYYDFFAGSLAGLLHIPKSSVVLQVVLPDRNQLLHVRKSFLYAGRVLGKDESC